MSGGKDGLLPLSARIQLREAKVARQSTCSGSLNHDC